MSRAPAALAAGWARLEGGGLSLQDAADAQWYLVQLPLSQLLADAERSGLTPEQTADALVTRIGGDLLRAVHAAAANRLVIETAGVKLVPKADRRQG